MHDPLDFLWWWNNLPKDRTLGKPQRVLGYWRIYLSNVKNESTIRFLSASGHRCNDFGELLLEDDEYSSFLNFEQMMEE